MTVWGASTDGFVGVQIGTYRTLEGKDGLVLQQIGTRVVHVYQCQRLVQIDSPTVQPVSTQRMEKSLNDIVLLAKAYNLDDETDLKRLKQVIKGCGFLARDGLGLEAQHDGGQSQAPVANSS